MIELEFLFALREKGGVRFDRRLARVGLAPEGRVEIAVGFGHGKERRFDKVAERTRVTRRLRVHVLHTGHRQEFFRHSGGNNASATRRRDETNAHGTALAREFARHGVRLSDFIAPVAATNRHDVHFGVGDGAANGDGHLFRALDAQANVTVAIADSDVRLEACALTGLRLFLHRHDFHHFVLQLLAEKPVDDLRFFDWQRVQVHLRTHTRQVFIIIKINLLLLELFFNILLPNV